MMWNSINPEILARLPRSAVNGSPNEVHPSLSVPKAEWNECFEKLEKYRSYLDDWDGQGKFLGKPATAIESEIVDSALALAKALERIGVSALHGTYPGLTGSVSFDWLFENGDSIEFDFVDPETADVFFLAQGSDIERLTLTEAISTI